MTNFSRKEIVSSTQLVRQFSTFMNFLKNKNLEKVGIIRNNEMEAVIIPIEEYEKLKAQAELKQRKSIKDFFGTMDQGTFDEMELALKDCRKVDVNEW